MTESPERLQVVDENDQPIGVATREEAWVQNLILRSIYIILRDTSGNFLLQQRSSSRQSNPNIWTWATTGHVDEGETYEIAAHREMMEEIGVDTPLTSIGKYHSSHPNDYGTLNCFISVFTGTITRDTPITIDPVEVATTRWFTPAELHVLVTETPENVTHNMRASYHKFFS